MKVLFDFDWLKQSVGGVSRCTVELLDRLPEDIDVQVAAKVSNNIYIHGKEYASNIEKVRVNSSNFLSTKKFPCKGTIYSICEKLFPGLDTFNNVNLRYAKELLKEQNFDIFHCPNNDCSTYFLDLIGNKPFVLTVHDMISEIMPNEQRSQTESKKRLIERADHIITVSKNTKKDLLSFFDIPEDKVSVIYHGGPNPISVIPERLYPEPYILFVGRRHTYKNFIQTLNDFARFSKIHKDFSLIAVGHPFNKQEIALISNLNLKEKVKSIFATDEELASLYKHAFCFVFPSVYEGFGLPILEAYTYGCPVLLNNGSCFPEIAEESALFFNSDVDSGKSNLFEKLQELIEYSDFERDLLIKKGYARLKDFSWEDSAMKLASVYERLL